jgi:hypothetical protein
MAASQWLQKQVLPAEIGVCARSHGKAGRKWLLLVGESHEGGVTSLFYFGKKRGMG